MQAAATTFNPQSETLRLGSAAQRLIVPGLILAAIGAGLAYVCTNRLGDGQAKPLLYHAYLVAFLFYLTITLGSLFFVMLHHLARSGWSVTLRRLAEALSGNVVLMAILFLPLALNLRQIYPWAEPKTAQQAVERLPEHAGTAGQPERAVAGHELWLTPARFNGRFVIYFVIWIFFAWYLRGHSILQDRNGGVALSRRMERVSAPGMILFGISITLAAVDLIMSMNPRWYSTMIGVYLFADAVLNGLVAVALLALWLQSQGLIRGAITKEHYHDLGKLVLGFVVFWAYIAFSQYMLIWYGNMPEETQFFMLRQIGPWVGVSLLLIVVHFVLPFLGLMSRHVKRFLPLLAFWLVWLLVAHALDLFWLVMPNVYSRQIAPDGVLPEAFKEVLRSPQSVYQLSDGASSLAAAVSLPLQPLAIALVCALLAAMGGLFAANTARLLQGHALVPVKDPRLNESLSFHNS